MVRSISVLTGAVQAITQDGWEAEPSPDGKQIVYVDELLREIRITGSLGESPRTFFRTPDGDVVASVHWLPGGKRIGYLTGKDGEPNARIETRDLEGKDPRRVLEANTESIAFAPDGHVFYTTKDSDAQPGASLWTIATDIATGAPIGRPVRLAAWPGAIAAQPLTISSDGRRLGVSKLYAQSDVYLLPLDPARRTAGPPRQLTTDTQADWPSQWTRDGSSFLFYSTRGGAMRALRQGVTGESPQTIVAGSAHVRAPQISPDGQWIVYVEMTSGTDAAHIMRVPIGGGPAQAVVDTNSRVATATLQYFAAGPGATGAGSHAWPDIRCPAQEADGSCFLAEARPAASGGSHVLLSQFDPASGRRHEIATLVEDRAPAAFWDVSPDGTLAAFGTFSWAGGDEITILTLATGERRIIRPNNVKNLTDVAWAADGRSLFATTTNIRRAEVFHIALDGTASLLRTFESQVASNPRPSPDGRSLLVGVLQTNANAWVIER